MPLGALEVIKSQSKFIGDFSLDDGGILPQNSYNPSQDLWEATLYGEPNQFSGLRDSSVHTDRHPVTFI